MESGGVELKGLCLGVVMFSDTMNEVLQQPSEVISKTFITVSKNMFPGLKVPEHYLI